MDGDLKMASRGCLMRITASIGSCGSSAGFVHVRKSLTFPYLH